MSHLRACFVLAMGSMLAGCGSSQPQSRPPALPHYQRFVPVPAEGAMTNGVPWHGFFALDTRTGTLCATTGFPIGEFKPMIVGRVFQGKSEWANDIPTCAQVLTANPD
jgi:hypothetical protein